MQTNQLGEYILDNDLFEFICKELSYDKNEERGKEEIYQHLLDYSLLKKETVVQAHGNSARVSVLKSMIGKQAKYWILILSEV